MKPLCFILMPFGRKATPAASVIDFDRVYAELIAPAVTDRPAWSRSGPTKRPSAASSIGPCSSG